MAAKSRNFFKTIPPQHRGFFSILFVLLLGIFVVIGYTAVQQQQTTQSRASETLDYYPKIINKVDEGGLVTCNLVDGLSFEVQWPEEFVTPDRFPDIIPTSNHEFNAEFGYGTNVFHIEGDNNLTELCDNLGARANDQGKESLGGTLSGDDYFCRWKSGLGDVDASKRDFTARYKFDDSDTKKIIKETIEERKKLWLVTRVGDHNNGGSKFSRRNNRQSRWKGIEVQCTTTRPPDESNATCGRDDPPRCFVGPCAPPDPDCGSAQTCTSDSGCGGYKCVSGQCANQCSTGTTSAVGCASGYRCEINESSCSSQGCTGSCVAGVTPGVTAGVTPTAPRTDASGDEPCVVDLGGTCKQPDSAANCPNGSYTSNLCGGPTNRRCCIPNSAVANKKTITVQINGQGRVTDKEGKINCTTRGEGVKHCSKTVNLGGSYQLEASPTANYHFLRWGPNKDVGKLCNAINSTTVKDGVTVGVCKGTNVREGRTIIANFATGGEPTPTPEPPGPANGKKVSVDVEGNGTVTSDPAGLNCTKDDGGTCMMRVRRGGQIVLIGTKKAQFIEWDPDSKCDKGTEKNRCRIKNIKTDLSMTAKFKDGGGPTETPPPTTPTPGVTEGVTPGVTETVTPPVPGCSRQGVACDSTILPGPWTPCCSDLGLTCQAVGDGTTSICQGAGVAATLNLKLSFQGVLKKPAGENAMNIKVSLVGGGQKQAQSAEFTVDDQGLWNGTVTFNNIEERDNYMVFVKGPKHVQKRICDQTPSETALGTYRCSEGKITLQAGENDLDFSGIRLLVGDLPEQDGVVDSYDISLVRQNLDSTNPEILKFADLNLDGIIDSRDFSLLIQSLNVKYDEE